jgi:hypothetical protein
MGGFVMSMRRFFCLGFALILFLWLAPASDGHFKPVEVQKVPVERLVANLNEAIKKDPKNVEAVVNLARLHGMAYSLKTETAELVKGREERGPWYGYTPTLIPFSEVEKAVDDAREKAAKSHLSKAVLGFRQAVKLAPDNMAARMGLAWALEQSGEKSAAIKEFRALIDDAWVKEKDLNELPLNGETVVTEAVGYLIPLLDQEKNKSEIDNLGVRTKRLRRLPRPITPIAVPLRAGLAARDIEDGTASVVFDADGSGLKRSWTWITRDAGWLVYDPKREGQISSGLDLFGSVTFWLFWNTGYDALQALDDNRDGKLTGTELAGLAIWQDSSHFGVCDAGEVKSLIDHGIIAVSCGFERDPNHPDKIAFSQLGVTFRDGTTRPTFDIILKPSDRRSVIPAKR